MKEPAAPPFEDDFDDGSIFPAGESASPEVSSADLAEVFAKDGGTYTGSHLGSLPHRPRFDGDTSQLPPEACWTLQELVAAPHVREQSKKHWSVLLQHEDVIRSRLCELGLILEINREHGYAFTRQAEDPSPHARTLLRARTLSLAASSLALYLYNQYVISPDDPVVETADMIDHMLGYKPPGDTDEAGFQRKIHAAIRSLEESSIIKPVTGTTRYVIYGVITSILSAERVEALDARYRAIAAGATADTSPHRRGISSDLGTDPNAGAGDAPVSPAEGEDDDA
jgi:hypothetical protein